MPSFRGTLQCSMKILAPLPLCCSCWQMGESEQHLCLQHPMRTRGVDRTSPGKYNSPFTNKRNSIHLEWHSSIIFTKAGKKSIQCVGITDLPWRLKGATEQHLHTPFMRKFWLTAIGKTIFHPGMEEKGEVFFSVCLQAPCLSRRALKTCRRLKVCVAPRRPLKVQGNRFGQKKEPLSHVFLNPCLSTVLWCVIYIWDNGLGLVRS